MKLGVISETSYCISDSGRKWDIHSFNISPDTISFFKIFHSAFATPARYVEEIFLRLCTLERDAAPSSKFVFNPLFDCGRLVIMQVLAAMRGLAPFDGVTVIVDKDGLPAGYIFPPSVQRRDGRFLTLLSTVDGHLDSALCHFLFRTDTRVIALPYLALSRVHNNGFLYKENQSIYRELTERAIDLLQKNSENGKEAIPFTAFMPHHAGDALFFVLAFNGTNSHFSRVAINRAYQEIVRDNAPNLEVLPLNAPLINRGEAFKKGEVAPESAYFESVKNSLPQDSFYYYCRPSRDYNVTLFHLIDHFAFAMGSRFCMAENLLTKRGGHPIPRRRIATAQALRVLLHFDGGWSLKIYPKAYQQQLIDMLFEKGYRISILAENFEEQAKCQVTNFKSYFHFKELLQTHDILVGMDSFPAHYATHIYGLPTICLFASTRPENSNAPGIPNYAFLEKGLGCRPCYGIVRCPLYGQTHCRNFVSPERVAAEVERMLLAGANKNTVGGMVQALPSEVEDNCFPGTEESLAKIKYISLRNVHVKVMLTSAVLPYINYVSLLYHEFSATVRTDGYLRAGQRASHFLRKAFRHWIS